MKNLLFLLVSTLTLSFAQAQTNVTWDRYNNEQDQVRWVPDPEAVSYDVMQDFTKNGRNNLPDGEIVITNWFDSGPFGDVIQEWSGYIGNIQGKKPVSYWVRANYSDGTTGEWIEAEKQ